MTRSPTNAFAAVALGILVGWSPKLSAAATFADATNGNTSLGTEQTIDEAPDLVLKSNDANGTFAQAQPVSPQYRSAEILGSISASHIQEFYSFNANTGNAIELFVTAQKPTGNVTELLLFDPSGNLVAVASGNGGDGVSSLIQFTVPGGDAGAWVVEVIGGGSNPSTNFFGYSLRLSSPIVYQTDVLGKLKTGASTDFFAVAANVGDNLQFYVSAGNPGTQFSELLLYDPRGDLVALASGNASDGSSSVIDFTVPSGDTGNWRIEVTGSPNVNPAKNGFNYDLRVQGATGIGPIDPVTGK